MLYNSFGVSLENLFSYQMIIPWVIVFFILITWLLNIVLKLYKEVLFWSVMGVKGLKLEWNDLKNIKKVVNFQVINIVICVHVKTIKLVIWVLHRFQRIMPDCPLLIGFAVLYHCTNPLENCLLQFNKHPHFCKIFVYSQTSINWTSIVCIFL